MFLQQCFLVCARKKHLLRKQNVSGKVKKHFCYSEQKLFPLQQQFLFLGTKTVFTTNVACARKQGKHSEQHCLLVCAYTKQLLRQQNVSGKDQKLFSQQMSRVPANRKTFRATMFPQQCFLGCGALYERSHREVRL